MLKVTAAMLLLGSSVAYAQAPGEYNPAAPPPPAQGYGPGYGYAQPPAPYEQVAPVIEVNSMRKRFSVSLNLGGMSLARNSDDYETSAFDVSELAFRYRLSPRLGVELSFNGGSEAPDYYGESDLSMGGGTAALQYHFRPDRAFNWYLLGGLGATIVAPTHSSQAERDDATRGHAMLGIGTEVRLSPHWALQGELRGYAIGVASATDENVSPPVLTDGGGMTTGVPPGATSRLSPDEGYSATQATVGVSFYF